MTVFFTSDLHLGHKLVSRLRFDKFSRYAGTEWPSHEAVVEWHDDTLTSNWDSTVTKDDQVWILGDLSGGSMGGTKRAIEWVSQRPGEKHLILGNHDPAHPMHRDSHKHQKMYFPTFASVQMAARRKITLLDPHQAVDALLSHFPYDGDREAVEPRHTEWRLRNHDYWLLHGHTHNTDKGEGRQIHIGLDAWNLKMLTLDDVRQEIEARVAAGHAGVTPSREEQSIGA